MSCAAASRAVAGRPCSRASRAQRRVAVCAQQAQGPTPAAADRRSLLLGLAGEWFYCRPRPPSCCCPGF